MSVTLLRPYGDYPIGTTLSLTRDSEASLVQQGIAVRVQGPPIVGNAPFNALESAAQNVETAAAFGAAVGTRQVLIAMGGNGTTTGAVTLNQAFKTIPLTTAVTDTAGSYNTTTGIYTIPESGLYLITAKMRLLDAQFIASTNYGLGVDIITGDATSFLWATTTGAGQRQGIVNSRIYMGSAGDPLRLYGYYDNPNGTFIGGAELNVVRIR